MISSGFPRDYGRFNWKMNVEPGSFFYQTEREPNEGVLSLEACKRESFPLLVLTHCGKFSEYRHRCMHHIE